MVGRRIYELMHKWEIELDELKSNLIEIGGKPESFEYNLLATEALALSQCIIDLQALIINVKEDAENAEKQKT